MSTLCPMEKAFLLPNNLFCGTVTPFTLSEFMTSGETILEGSLLQLEPIKHQHREGLEIAAAHDEVWRYMPYQATKECFNAWFEETINKMSLGTQITYVVCRKKDQKILGATAYYDMHLDHKRLSWGTVGILPVCGEALLILKLNY